MHSLSTAFRHLALALACGLAGAAQCVQAADIAIGQVGVVREYHALLDRYAPHAVIKHTSFKQFPGAKVLVEALRGSRIGSRDVEVTVVGSNGKLLK